FHVLGTDGYGRSDSREALRHHFEVDRYYVVVTALSALLKQAKESSVESSITAKMVQEAIDKYGIDAEKTNPLYA
ncbi:MAG: pyruvate dehydrogenase E1 component, partial [Pseudoalteromonas tetraodonis]